MGLNADAATKLRAIVEEGGDEAQMLGRALRLLAIWRSKILANTEIVHEGRKVLSGPFAGMEYIPFASEGALLPRLTGAYECELHPHLLALAGEGLKRVIDVGCAEGYYAVGLARLMPEVTVHAFDIDPKARAACGHLATINGVADRVEVGESFSGEDFDRFQGPETLVFMDIEGGELELLDPARWPALRTVKIVVETHGGPDFLIAKELSARFAESHHVVRVDHGAKDAPLPEWMRRLDHLDQLLAGWEWRRWPTPWLVMRPKG
jgi:hypothetical protein